MVVNEIEEKRWMDDMHNVTYLCCFVLWFWAYGLFSTKKMGILLDKMKGTKLIWAIYTGPWQRLLSTTWKIERKYYIVHVITHFMLLAFGTYI